MTSMLLELERRQKRTGLSEELIARDMMQARLLSAMFDGAVSREIALKGGVAMRAAYGSHRYTKDIDLQSCHEVPMGRVRSIVENAIRTAFQSGILEKPFFSAPKQTDTVQRWKIGGIIPGGGSTVNMTIEVSRRGMPHTKLVYAVAYAPHEGETKAVMLEVYSPMGMALAKVDCLLNENRVAVRDLFDLNMLITMRVDPPVEFLRTLGKDALVKGLTEVWTKLEVMDWEMAQNDLLPFIPKEQAALLSEDVWDEMRLRTGEAVCGWINAALEAESNGAVPSP